MLFCFPPRAALPGCFPEAFAWWSSCFAWWPYNNSITQNSGQALQPLAHKFPNPKLQTVPKSQASPAPKLAIPSTQLVLKTLDFSSLHGLLHSMAQQAVPPYNNLIEAWRCARNTCQPRRAEKKQPNVRKNKAQSLRKKRTPKTTFVTAPFPEGLGRDEGCLGDPLFELECRIPARIADPQDNLHHGPLSGGIGRRSAFRAGMPDSSSKSGSPRQPSSRPPFRRDWLGIRFSSWNAGFQLERIHKTKADPQNNLHHGPLSEGIGWGSPFRAGMPDSSSKSGYPRQPSSRPPFRRDWLGIRFSSWNAGFQLEKRIPKTTFITAPFQEGLAGDPVFELDCGSLRQPSSRFSVRRDWPGIRFSSWNAGFQLKKRIRKTTFITAPFQEGLAGDPLFELEYPAFQLEKRIPKTTPDSSSKSGSPRQPSSRPPFRRDWLGIRFSSWNAGFQLEKRIPKTTFITAPFQEGLAWDPLFELECRIPARKADPQDNLHHGPLSGGICWGSEFQLKKRIPKTTFITAPFQEGLAGDPLFELECRIPAQKADPQDNLHHGPLSGGIGFRKEP